MASQGGASHLGLAGCGDRDRQSKTARGRETCFSGPQLASLERHTRRPVSLDRGHLLGRGHGLEQRAALLGRARREEGGAEACQARGQARLAEAQRGGAGGHRPGARGPLGPLSGHNVLDCSTAWLADREQWLAEGSGRQPNVGGAAWPERRLVLTTCPATLGKERTSLSGGRQGAWRPVGTSAIPPYPGPQWLHVTRSRCHLS